MNPTQRQPVWNETARPELSFMNAMTERTMPVILWLLGVPLVVVIALMLTHVI
jgi:hypothetical protein